MLHKTRISNVSYTNIKIRETNIIKTRNLFEKFPLEDLGLETTDIDYNPESINNVKIENLNYLNNQNKHIFENLNFELKKGEKIFIKGLSGSGKSTFLDILSGLNNDYSGKILINGKSNNKNETSNEATYSSSSETKVVFLPRYYQK